jgi:hypothetical protein
MPNLDLTINEDDPNQAGLLAFSSPGILSLARPPDFVKGDVMVYNAVKTVRETPDGFEYSHLSTDTYVVAIGNPDTPSTAGSVSFDVDGTPASDIPFDASAAAFQAIFSPASVTAGFGTVTATKLQDGVYQLDWTTDGEVPDGDITGDESELVPASQIVISPISVGSVSSKAQYVIQWKQAPVAQASPTTELEAASVTASTQQSATYTRNKIVKIEFNDGIVGGTFSVAATVLGVDEGVGIASPLMTAQQLGQLLSIHSLIEYLNTDGTADNIIVTKSQDAFYVEFTGTLAGSTLRKTIATSSAANPSVITTSADHNFADGDTVTISNHSGSTPDINSQHVITWISSTTFSIPVNVTVGGTGGRVFNNSEPDIDVTNIDLIAEKGKEGTIGLNTINLAKSFFALDSSTQEQTFKLSVKRTRLSGEERTLLLIDVIIKRNLIDLSSIVDMPSLLAFLFQRGELAVSSAGTSEVTIPSACKFYTLRVAVAAGAGVYARNIDLPVTGRTSGDKCMVVLVMAASTNPTVTIRDNAPTSLYPEAGTGVAYTRPLWFTFNGTAWESDQSA